MKTDLLLGSLEEDGCVDLLDGSCPGPDLSVDEELGAIDVGPVDVCRIIWADLQKIFIQKKTCER
jgi:hypothetical protein